MELSQEQLDQVLAGNDKTMEAALNNPDLFRKEKIEELQKLKDQYLNSSKLEEEQQSKSR